jgi:hypothetical protein
MDEGATREDISLHPPVNRKKLRLNSGRQFNISRLLGSSPPPL